MARGYAARGCRYTRGQLIGIHRDWKKTWVSDVCWVLIHRDSYELMNSNVFCLFLPACAGIHFEEKRVESREINWDTSGLRVNFEFRCIMGWQFLAIHRDGYHLMNSDVFWYVDI